MASAGLNPHRTINSVQKSATGSLPPAHQLQMALPTPSKKPAATRNNAKTMGISNTDTGFLDDFRKTQLRGQVVQHTDDQLPPLHLPGMAEEVIRAAGSGIGGAAELPAR